MSAADANAEQPDALADYLACETCAFWHNTEGEADGPKIGECRRHPPRLMARHDDAEFPTTMDEEWCGEWQHTFPPAQLRQLRDMNATNGGNAR